MTNPDEVICPACTHQFRAIPENVQAQLSAKRKPLPLKQINSMPEAQGGWSYADSRRVFKLIRAVERAAYERAAQECIETAAELRRCADGCTDGRYDWKADGADDCADAIRALGRQHD